MSLEGAHVGGYWTHIGPGEWYVDTVLMGSFFDGNPRSITGNTAHVHGNGFTGSVEAGYPIPISGNWRIEPQVQAIYQTLGFNHANDTASSVSFKTNDTFVLRGGLRLMDTLQLESGALLQPYARSEYRHTTNATDRIAFGNDSIGVGQGASSVEFGAGVVAKLSENGVWAYISTATSISTNACILWAAPWLRYTLGRRRRRLHRCLSWRRPLPAAAWCSSTGTSPT